MSDHVESSILRDDVRQQLDAIGEVDILVGIPSFNNARTISHVVSAVTAGLSKYFPDHRAILVNSDGGSLDGTQDIVRHTEVHASQTLMVTHKVRRVRKVVTAYQGVPGKGSAFRTVFEIADRLGAKACAVVDSDLRSITPEWIELLVGPVLHREYDYVCPLYSRHKYDGTITNSIVYPMVRTLYGKRIRQPIGGDFGFSGRLATHFLEQDVWDSDVARFGIDIWMTTTALMGGFNICQSYLGAKIHDAKDPGADLSAMLVQVVGALLQQMETHEAHWPGITGSEMIPEFGFRYDVGLEPVAVNIARMVDTFERGFKDFEPIYASFLSPSTMRDLRGQIGQKPHEFHMPVDTWIHLLFDYAAACHHRRLPGEHLLRTLTPLYLGRTASWINQAGDYGAQEVETELDAVCEHFEAQKPYLLECWKGERSSS